MARGPFYQILGTTFTDALTAGAGADTYVMATVTNIQGSTMGTAEVDFTDSSDGDTAKVLLKTTEVAAGDAVDVRSRGIMLKAGDVLRGKASAANTLAIDGWFEEIT